MLIHIAKRPRQRAQTVLENQIYDASLFVSKQRAERERVLMELLVQDSNHRRCIRSSKRFVQFFTQFLKLILVMKLAHATRDVVVAQVQNRKAERGFFFGDLRTYAASSHRETNAPFRFNAVLLPFDRVAIDFGL